MRIGDRTISDDHPPYIIAEIGVNHDGSVARALELTAAAAEAGADAVKLQYFEADRLMSRAAALAAYQAGAGERDPLVMLRRLELTLDDMGRVVALAHERGIHTIVTVFTTELVGAARALRWDAFKTASPDIIHLPLLRAIMADGRPIIASTGASSLAEVERAIGWLAPARDRLALLHCVSAYPAPDPAFEGVGALREVFEGPVGYSDHVAGVDSAASAMRAGAAILEKHLTYDRAASGPDHAASLDPAQFAQYVDLAREAWRPGVPPAPGRKAILACEEEVRRLSRQSITTTRPLRAGHKLTSADLTCKRPGAGLVPWRLDDILGRALARDVAADTPLRADDIA